MKALTRSIYDNCEGNRPVWLPDRDVFQEEKHEYNSYWWQLREPEIEIIKIAHSIHEKSIAYQIEMTFQEDEYDEELVKFNKAKEAFYKKLPELIVEHEGKYAAIIDDDIIIDEKEEAVFEKTTKRYGDITIYIGEIVDEKLELEITQKYVLE